MCASLSRPSVSISIVYASEYNQLIPGGFMKPNGTWSNVFPCKKSALTFERNLNNKIQNKIQLRWGTSTYNKTDNCFAYV